MALINWNQRVSSIISTINAWENRTLTLLGKVLIVNTLVLSPLFYLAPIYPLPTSVERVMTRAVGWQVRFVPAT